MMRCLGVLLCLLVGVASPLMGQATPSIANPPRFDERRDVVSLREYIDIRLNALEDKVKAQDVARQLAIDKAENTINMRLESMNEFRAQLKDQANAFATKEETETRARQVDAHLAEIDNWRSSIEGQMKVYAGLFLFVNAVLGIWLSRRTIGIYRGPKVHE